MIGRRWFGPPHGDHRVPAPGSLAALADEARTRAEQDTTLIRMVPTPEDTRPFDARELWTGPLPKRKPASPPAVEPSPGLGANWAPIPLDIAGVFDPLLLDTLRRDFEDLPGFRGTVLALTDASPMGFAGLHERIASGGKTS